MRNTNEMTDRQVTLIEAIEGLSLNPSELKEIAPYVVSRVSRILSLSNSTLEEKDNDRYQHGNS